MKSTSRCSSRRRVTAHLAFAALTSLLASSLRAQVSNTSESPKSDDVVQLNPFMVTTNQDVGYLAQNSLSGSRLNTNLGDLAVPSTAFTKEFLDDVAITNVDDLTKYMLSTKPDVPEGDNLFMADDSRRFRIRGLPAFNYSVNFFETNLRLDRFSTDRIEQSRGPNSILFGLGSPGGVVNVATKKASDTRTFGSIRLQAHDNNGLRTEIDYNQPLIAKKLAIRIAAVRDYEDTWRTREFDNQRRIFGTAGWQISPKTRLDVEGEYGRVHKSLLQPMTASDAYTNWVAAGSRIGDTPNAAQAIKRISTTNYEVVDTTTNQVMNWINKTNSTTNTVAGTQIWLQDFSVLPKDVVVSAGVAAPQNTDYYRGSFFLTHAFSPDLSFELAGNAQDSDHEAVTMRSGTLLQVDTSTTLPNGQANPNVGRTYVEHFPGTVDEYNSSKNLRLSGAYTRDFGKWFGRHQLAGLYQMDWIARQAWQLRPAITTNPYNTADPNNGQNSLRFRTYFDLRGDKELIGVADWRKYFGGSDKFRDNTYSFVDATTGRQMTAEWIMNAVPQDNNFERNSAMGILQSSFLDNRLVTVAGVRQDRQESWYSVTDTTLARGPAQAPFAIGEYIARKTPDSVSNQARNVTYSALFRVTKNIALTYNRSRNAALPDPNAFIVNDSDPTGRPPSPLGKSEDIGVKFNLGRRLSASIVYYKTSANKDTANSNTEIENRFPTIWTALAAAGVAAPGGGSALDVPNKFNRYTFNSQAKGYEFELVANVTDSWRMFLNYSDGVVRRTQIGQESQAYVAKYRDFWSVDSNARVLIDGSGGRATVANDGDATIETVGEQLASIESNIRDLYIAPDGEQGRGQVRRSFNAVTNYVFKTGFLKGFQAGMGANYRDGEVIAYNVTTTSAGSTADVIYGKKNLLFDANISYGGQFKAFSKNVRYKIQLNVNNILDEDQILPTRQINGVVTTYRVQEPRAFILSTNFDF